MATPFQTMAPETIVQIRKLKAEGMGMKRIAATLHVSKNSVEKYAGNGKTYAKRKLATHLDGVLMPSLSGVHREKVRCPTCGVLVQNPCWACHIRGLQTRIGEPEND